MTKEKILDAVIEMIKNGNADMISMSKIAKQADIGKSTIYEYFNTKDDLMELAVKRMIDKYVEMFLQAKFGKTSYESFYNHMIVGIQIRNDCRQIMDIAKYSNVSFFATDVVKKYVAMQINKIVGRLEEIYFRAIEDGTLCPKRDFDNQKYIIIGLIKGSLLCCEEGNGINNEKVIRDIYENLLVLLNN